MKRLLILISLLSAITLGSKAQIDTSSDYNQLNEDGTFTTNRNQRKQQDSLGTDKEIPIGLKTWTVNRFGDRTPTEPDTISHMYMNSIFTTGMRGEYNTLGNLGSPRVARIFIDRRPVPEFLFAAPYDFFLTNGEDFHFTNTLSPFTNLSFNTCGNRTNGEDHFLAKFGANAGKRIGMGFKFDYIYGRGYYSTTIRRICSFQLTTKKWPRTVALPMTTMWQGQRSLMKASSQPRFQLFWNPTGTAMTTTISS